MTSKQETIAKIMTFLGKTAEPLSKRQIARKNRFSPATISKYVEILHAQGLLEVKNYGNIDLVQIRR